MLTVKLHKEELEFIIMDVQNAIDLYERQLKQYGDDPQNHLVHRWKAELLTRKAIVERLKEEDKKAYEN